MKLTMSLILLVFIQASALSAHAETTQEERRKIFKECADQVGLPKPEAGQKPQRPDETMKSKLDACLKSKGLTPPQDFGGRPPRPPESQGVQ
ncbi:MAG: hypothetical protein JSU04_16245 [Bdellovibrionales bacterium]|nr:hypothetical protein [Bdellovibrionales bacterium]